jgi:hypothetical protein
MYLLMSVFHLPAWLRFSLAAKAIAGKAATVFPSGIAEKQELRAFHRFQAMMIRSRACALLTPA